MMTFVSLLFSSFLVHADIDGSYNDCVKAARGDAESAQCLDAALVATDKALGDVINQLIGVLNANADSKPKAKMLQDAHAKWLPSRDADCQLQGAVTMDTPEDAADAAKLCVYQADVPRLRQYQRFLGFLKP